MPVAPPHDLFASLRRTFAAVAAILLLGCYAYIPLNTAPTPGTDLALQLNDRGRVAVADSLGPEVRRVEGVLVRGDDSVYVIGVSRVETIGGLRSRWMGEVVGIRREYVNSTTERRLSKQRTALAVGGTVVVVTAFILTRDLLGLGLGGGDDGGGDGADARIIRLPPTPISP